MTRTQTFAATLCCVALLAATASAGLKPWAGGEGRGVKTKHLAMPLTEEPHYSDRYTIEAWFEDGTIAYVSVLVKNFGLKKGTMTVKSRWHDADGTEHKFSKDVAKGGYHASSEPFEVKAAGHRLSGTPRRFRVEAKGGNYSFDLKFSSGLAPFRPGTGRTVFDDIGVQYYDHTRVQPRATVTGWVKKGGAKKKLKGYGYVTHSISTIAPYAMYKRYLQVRSISGDTVVYIDQFATPKKLGGRPVGYLYLARDGKVVAASGAPRLKFEEMWTDNKHANRYKVPHVIRTKLKRKNKQIEITVKTKKMIGREDVIAGLNGLEAAVVKQFAQPVNYTLDAEITVSIQEGDSEPVVTTLPARYELSHLNR